MVTSADPQGQGILCLVRSWPTLSQTFVLDEVLRLQRAGVPIRLVALSASQDELQQDEVDDLAEPVRFLDTGTGRRRIAAEHAWALTRLRLRYLRAAWHVLRHPEWDRGYHVASRWRCLTLAVRLTALIRRDVDAGTRSTHLHAHFAHDPAAVALLTHRMSGLSWSFTGHARDVWQVPPEALADRVRSAAFAVTCSAAAGDQLRAAVPAALRERVKTVPHGVDVEAFRPRRHRRPPGVPSKLISVGRLVEKKGFDDLVDACAKLAQEGHDFTCTVIGDGPMRQVLEERIVQRGLTGVVRFAGARTRSDLLPLLHGADLFVLTPRVTADGDRDGIPNSLLEAMACGLPVVATTAGGIPEAVQDGVEGLLARPDDPADVADRLARLLGDPELRQRLGDAARRTAVRRFDSAAATRSLAALFADQTGAR